MEFLNLNVSLLVGAVIECYTDGAFSSAREQGGVGIVFVKDNEIIYKYLRENESYLQQICNRTFGSEFQKIRYFSAVLKNSLRDYVPKVETKEVPKVVVDETIYEAPTQSLNKRRSLAELEDMF